MPPDCEARAPPLGHRAPLLKYYFHVASNVALNVARFSTHKKSFTGFPPPKKSQPATSKQPPILGCRRSRGAPLITRRTKRIRGSYEERKRLVSRSYDVFPAAARLTTTATGGSSQPGSQFELNDFKMARDEGSGRRGAPPQMSWVFSRPGGGTPSFASTLEATPVRGRGECS